MGCVAKYCVRANETANRTVPCALIQYPRTYPIHPAAHTFCLELVNKLKYVTKKIKLFNAQYILAVL